VNVVFWTPFDVSWKSIFVGFAFDQRSRRPVGAHRPIWANARFFTMRQSRHLTFRCNATWTDNSTFSSFALGQIAAAREQRLGGLRRLCAANFLGFPLSRATGLKQARDGGVLAV
jgi:hypothetical protein